MKAPPFHTLHSPIVQLLRDDIDTDQIIPARFLTTVSREGLGAHLFADWRYDANGSPRADFALNRPTASNARILLAGRNFGCGSSREHAPWALLDWGIRAIIAPSFADIFRSNANRNGLLTVALDAHEHAALATHVTRVPNGLITVDLEQQEVRAADIRVGRFDIDPFTKRCLREGVDELGYLLSALGDIAAFESARARHVVEIDVRMVHGRSRPSSFAPQEH